MGKLIIVVGATASGKDSLVNELQANKFKRYMSYTTRPKREGEIAGKEYYFVTKNEFDEEVANNNVVAHREYNVAGGDTWYYFYKKEDLDLSNKQSYCCIADVGGALELVNHFGKVNTMVIYLATPLSVCVQRALYRENMDNNKIKELCRRVTSDIEEIIENPKLEEIVDLHVPMLDADAIYDILYDLGCFKPSYNSYRGVE